MSGGRKGGKRPGNPTIDIPQHKRPKKAREVPVTDTPKTSEEVELEALLFGGADVGSESERESESGIEREKTEEGKGAGAWHDSDDEGLTVKVDRVARLRKLRVSEKETAVSGPEFQARLREQHQKLSRANEEWLAGPELDSDEEEAAGLTQVAHSTERLTRGSEALPRSVIAIQRLSNANIQAKSKSVVQSVRFHPSGMLLTAGLDQHLRLFRVDGKTNPIAKTLFLKDLPITCAEFGGSQSNRIFASGRRGYFYCVDLDQGGVARLTGLQKRQEKCLDHFTVNPVSEQLAFVGNGGNIILTDPHTQQEAFTLKATAHVNTLAFTSATTLLTVGKEGLMHVFDLRMRRCRNVCKDQGSLECTSLSVQSNEQSSRMVAVGNNSGVVNMYTLDDVEQSRAPQPLKSLMNLTTRISNIAFNPRGEVLAIASHSKQSGIRLVHLPSHQVFQNWPTKAVPLKKVGPIAFNTSGGLMAIGNDHGDVLLFRLKHYPFC